MEHGSYSISLSKVGLFSLFCFNYRTEIRVNISFEGDNLLSMNAPFAQCGQSNNTEHIGIQFYL